VGYPRTCTLASRLKQRGLADPGRPFDHRNRPLAGLSCGQQTLKRRKLAPQLEQRDRS